MHAYGQAQHEALSDFADEDALPPPPAREEDSALDSFLSEVDAAFVATPSASSPSSTSWYPRAWPSPVVVIASLAIAAVIGFSASWRLTARRGTSPAPTDGPWRATSTSPQVQTPNASTAARAADPQISIRREDVIATPQATPPSEATRVDSPPAPNDQPSVSRAVSSPDVLTTPSIDTRALVAPADLDTSPPPPPPPADASVLPPLAPPVATARDAETVASGRPVLLPPPSPEPRAAPRTADSRNGASSNDAGGTSAAMADEGAIRGVLAHYQSAYERLDAGAAKAVWPSLDERALSRAFDGLVSQDVQFDACNVSLAGVRATASCTGEARYVRRVGNRNAQAERRQWTFFLAKNGAAWQIASVQVR
jgi:hypothetical protein